MPVLQNGHLFPELRPISIENCLLALSNTCAFDSLLQILLRTAADNEDYFNYIATEIKESENSIDSIFFKMVTNILISGIDQETYISRANLMRKYFTEVVLVPGGTVHINCKTFVDLLSEFLQSNHPSLSITHTCLIYESHAFIDEKINFLVRFHDLRNQNIFQRFLLDGKYLRSKGTSCNACEAKTFSSTICGE